MKKEELKTELLNILFKHRANDRGNKELNLFDDKKELQEQDLYYAEMIFSLFQKEKFEILDIIESRLRRYNCGKHWLLVKRIEELKESTTDS